MKTWMTRDPVPLNTNPRIGEYNYNSNNSYSEIIDYNTRTNLELIMISISSDLDIHYYNNNKSSYSRFISGYIKSPYDNSIYSTGYLGEGIYKPTTHPRIYAKWKSMMLRSCSINFKLTDPAYKDVTSDPLFHNFQNFGQWYDLNYYEFPRETMHLDKDLLFKGNKMYGPNTCTFLPQTLNNLTVKSEGIRGDTPVGVSYNGHGYTSTISINGVKDYLGSYPTPEEAFNVYKIAKENEIKRVANVYWFEKGGQSIPQFKKVYDALMNYQVEITD